MALVLIPGPDNAPSTVADWEKINDVFQTIGLDINSPTRISGSKILRGSVIFFAGAWYVADSDTAISGSATDYVRLTNTAGVVTAAFVPSLSGVTFNRTWNGWYDPDGNLYIFNEMKAYAAGAISDPASIRDWRPENAETAKVINQATGSGWADVLAQTPTTSGKVYDFVGSGGNVDYYKGKGVFTLGKDSWKLVGSISCQMKNDAALNLVSLRIQASNGNGPGGSSDDMDVEIREGASVLASARGSDIDVVRTIGGQITSTARTLNIYARVDTVSQVGLMSVSVSGSVDKFSPNFLDWYCLSTMGDILS